MRIEGPPCSRSKVPYRASRPLARRKSPALQDSGVSDRVDAASTRLSHLIKHPESQIDVSAVNASFQNGVHHDRVQPPIPSLGCFHLLHYLIQLATTREEHDARGEWLEVGTFGVVIRSAGAAPSRRNGAGGRKETERSGKSRSS